MMIDLETKRQNPARMFHYGTCVRQNVNTGAQDSDCVGPMTQRRMESLQVRLGGIQNGRRPAPFALAKSCASLLGGFARSQLRERLKRNIRPLLLLGESHESEPVGARNPALLPTADGGNCLVERLGHFASIAEGGDD